MGASYKLKLLKPLCPPYQYAVEATNYCNFRCSFCPQSDPEHRGRRQSGFLTLEDFQLYLQRIKAEKPGNINLSICLDGEPLMNKQFPEFIRLAHEQGFFPRFSSNGRLITPETADRLAQAGGFLASIDFSPDPAIFETIRGKPGDFKVVLDNLQHLVRLAQSNPRVQLEIVDISGFTGCDPKLSLHKMRDLFPPELPANIAFWNRIFHNFAGHLTHEIKKTKYTLCPYPWSTMSVTWEGDVVACCRDTAARTRLGNVFQKPIREIWLGDKFTAMRRDLVEGRPDKIAACKNCDMPWSGDTAPDRWRLSNIISTLLRR